MEFHNRKACIDYYDAQFPHLPRYMIEMAFDLDQTQSKKKMTGSERRALKHVQPPKKEEKKEGCARVIPSDEYVMPPMIEGAINVDGASLETSACEAIELPEK
jgi:hypothetical protein